MENILVTGGAGFIGSTLSKRLANNYSVFVIDDLSMGDVSNIENKENITFIKGSVTDSQLMKEILTAYEFKFIFHLAAIASVADSVARPLETHKVNFDSVLLLLELIRNNQSKLKRFVFTSSAAVYGDEPTLPKKEESVIRPLTPYAVDKFAAEQYVLNYNNLYGVPTSAVRFFNVYGPNQNSNSPYSGVISILLDKYQALSNGQNAHFTLFGDGLQSRDFVYVEDVVDALLLVANRREAQGKQFNVGTGKQTTLLDLIKILNDIFELDLLININPARSGDIKSSYSDIQRITNLGFSPHYTVDEGLKLYSQSL